MKDNKDRDEVLAAVKEDGLKNDNSYALRSAHKSLKKDKEIVLAAVKQNGWALFYAHKSLKNDKEIVMEAVKQHGLALESVDESLKKDKEIVMAAVKQNGNALKYVDESLKKDKEIVLAAVKQDGKALYYADKSLKKNKEIVMAAVKQNGSALEYADESLKKNKEIVMAAVKQNADALLDADESLKKDKEIFMIVRKSFLAGLKQDGYHLQYPPDESLKKDKEIVMAAVKQNGSALEYADESLKKDKEIVMAAVRQHGWALEYADESLKKDKEIVMAAVKQHGYSLKYADKIFRKDKDFIKAAEGMEIDSPKIWFTCPELNYFDLTVEEQDLNSIEKISDAIDDVISGGEGESTAHLVLGKLPSNNNALDYLDMESSDVDISDFTNEGKGMLIENPKKGEVVFVYFYYYNHASNVLTKNKNFKNIIFESKVFKGEAVLTGYDYSGFDLDLIDASGGGEYQLEIICSNGQTFLGTPEGKDELIKELHGYLTTPKG